MRVSAEIVRRGLPPHVGVGVRRVDELGETVAPPIYDVEAEALGPRAVPQRRTLFALGRAAARDALLELGVGPTPIARSSDGAPAWPDGFVGAISHTRHVAVGIAGRRHEYVGLGVDVEELDRGVRPDIARLVCRPAEMEWVDIANGLERLMMLFSAKESIFKALYPIERVWLGFGDAELRWDANRHTFLARVLKSFGRDYLAGFELDVNCILGPGFVLTTTFVPAGGGRRMLGA
jgi:4'-phosphopantetheinyl transferase EntD